MDKIKKVSSILIAVVLIIMFAIPSPVDASIVYKKTCIGYTEQLTVYTKEKVTWSSSDKSVATVSSKGLVTGKGTGSCFIYAKHGKQIMTWLFTIIPAKEEVAYYHDISNSNKDDDISNPPNGLEPKRVLEVGEKDTLFLDDFSGKAKWESSNKEVVTVSSSGYVAAKKKGTANITATVNKKKYTCRITVVDKIISSNIGSLNMKVGEEKEVKITIKNDEKIIAKLKCDDPNLDPKDVINFEYGERKGETITITIRAYSEGSGNITVFTEDSYKKIIIPIKIESKN